jgi:hypothetical protein
MITEESRRRYSQASKARLAKLSPEQLSQRMKAMAKAKWSRMSTEERSAHGLLMANKKKENAKKEGIQSGSTRIGK